MTVLRVEQRRGPALEAVHVVDAVMCDKAGRVVASVGDDMLTTFRSAAKPFQLEVSWGLLPEAVRARLEPADLALGAASHHGEPMHIERVQSLLARLGRAQEHLFCGVHAPSNAAAAEALCARGQKPCVLHNNCSGKHSFMAAATAQLGAASDYRASDHPLQQRMIANLQRRTGQGIAGTVIDGCGIPCFVLPLSAMARAWAELAVAMTRSDDEPLGAIGRAMRDEPLMMSGSDAFDGWLIRSTKLVAKIGAGGLLCVALPEQGLGLAVKIQSGSDVPRPVAGLAVLEKFVPGLVREALPERFSVVTNLVGTRVGEIRALWT